MSLTSFNIGANTVLSCLIISKSFHEVAELCVFRNITNTIYCYEKNTGIHIYICMRNVHLKLNNCIAQTFVHIIYKSHSGLEHGRNVVHIEIQLCSHNIYIAKYTYIQLLVN